MAPSENDFASSDAAGEQKRSKIPKLNYQKIRYHDENERHRQQLLATERENTKSLKEYEADKEQLTKRLDVVELENNKFKTEIRNETAIQDLPDNSRYKTMDANHKVLVTTQVALAASHQTLNERQNIVDKD
ncbi:hypothetical protein FSARC_10444 [Fusarium sarcochroum]|uniref:Uncharacterized protein n=1 Tax=Fusarium sarcochroum TaxID=1208366 RepID=A0A8H4X3Y4_9HYPO|nr:hypothetical protein FSARC_10444 [Fusarium sarcochroum]